MVEVRGRMPGPLFRTRRGLPLSRKACERLLDSVIKKSEVQPFTFHCLRHTCGTQLARMEVPLDVIQGILGHDSLETTAIYLKTSAADLQVAKTIAAKWKQTQGSVTKKQTAARQGGLVCQ